MILNLLGSSFCGRSSTTIRAYVIVLSLGILSLSACDMKNIVFVPGVSSYPCASLPSSFDVPLLQITFVCGSFRSSSSFVIVLPVIGWKTPEFAKLGDLSSMSSLESNAFGIKSVSG